MRWISMFVISHKCYIVPVCLIYQVIVQHLLYYRSIYMSCLVQICK